MNRLKLVVIGVLVIALVGCGTAAAATVMKGNSRYEAMIGGSFVVTNSITLSEEGNGFVVMMVNLTEVGGSPENPVYFNASGPLGGLACTAISENDWIYDVRLYTTASTPANSVFKVEFRGTGGFYIANLYVATDSTVEPGEKAACLFRIGPTLNSPYSYRVTVQKMP